MKAWMLKEFGGLGALELREDVEVPAPGGGEVRVRLQFAGLNPADRYLSEKLYPARPSFPHILGRDGSGVVEAVGAGVSGLKEGDAVALLRGEAGVSRWGTFAEAVVVPAGVLVPIPEGWSMEEAAAAPLVYLTAWQALTQWGELPEGSFVAVSGVSGGVGLASLHLAKALGLKVIGLTRSAEKGELLSREHGLDHAVDPGAKDLRDQLRGLTGKAGIALYVDNIGGELFNTVLGCLGKHGRMSCVGRLGGEVPSLNTARLFFNRLRIGGVSVGDYGEEEARRAWGDVTALLNQSGKRPAIDSVHPFGELVGAFRKLEKGPLGKVLLRVEG